MDARICHPLVGDKTCRGDKTKRAMVTRQNMPWWQNVPWWQDKTCRGDRTKRAVLTKRAVVTGQNVPWWQDQNVPQQMLPALRYLHRCMVLAIQFASLALTLTLVTHAHTRHSLSHSHSTLTLTLITHAHTRTRHSHSDTPFSQTLLEHATACTDRKTYAPDIGHPALSYDSSWVISDRRRGKNLRVVQLMQRRVRVYGTSSWNTRDHSRSSSFALQPTRWWMMARTHPSSSDEAINGDLLCVHISVCSLLRPRLSSYWTEAGWKSLPGSEKHHALSSTSCASSFKPRVLCRPKHPKGW